MHQLNRKQRGVRNDRLAVEAIHHRKGITMSDERTPVWGVHMGRPGGRAMNGFAERADEVQRQGYVAVGWPELGDMSALMPARDDFRRSYRERFSPNQSIRSEAAAVGMLFRFVHEMKIGNLIATPSPTGGPIRIGRIVNHYEYNPGLWADYPNLRQVKWIACIPRGDLDPGSRKSLRSQRSLFRFQAGADEIRRIASSHGG